MAHGKLMKNSIKTITLIIIIALLCGCKTNADRPPKYIFLFIGDGMGNAHIALTEYYLKETGGTPLCLSEFDTIGQVSTYCEDSVLTDSSAAATAIATGHKTTFENLNVNADGSVRYETVAQKLKEQKNMKVGIISSQYINHATPAGFYAHQGRYDFYDIGLELAGSGFDYFAGGDLIYRTGDDGMQPDLYEIIRDAGYNITNDIEGMVKHEKNVILRQNGTIPFYIDEKDGVSIIELTRLGIELLDNPNGFFMMIEGGKIDTAAHANDAKTVIEEVINLSLAIEEALKFYRSHKDETLIILTADHETGGLALGNSNFFYGLNLSDLDYQKMSYYEFTKIIDGYKNEGKDFYDIFPSIAETFRLTPSESEILNLYGIYQNLDNGYSSYNPFVREVLRLYNKNCGVTWGTIYHTASPVPIYAAGSNSAYFAKNMDNTDIFKILSDIFALH